MKRPAFGIDPGTPGAAVLLDPEGACLLAAYWVAIHSGNGLHLRWWSRRHGTGHEYLMARYSAVGEALLELFALEDPGQRCRLRVEGVFVGKNPQTAITLARAAGELVGPLQEHLSQSATHVKAVVWRRALLGLKPSTPAAECKAASLKMMPFKCPGLLDALVALGAHDHITDAAGVARSGQVTR